MERIIRNQSKYLIEDDVSSYYDWKKDFPINYQNKKRGSKSSKFVLEFELNDNELLVFNRLTGSRFTSYDFIINIQIGQSNVPNIKVIKTGLIIIGIYYVKK